MTDMLPDTSDRDLADLLRNQRMGMFHQQQPTMANLTPRAPWQCPGCRVYHAPWIDRCPCSAMTSMQASISQLSSLTLGDTPHG